MLATRFSLGLVATPPRPHIICSNGGGGMGGCRLVGCCALGILISFRNRVSRRNTSLFLAYCGHSLTPWASHHAILHSYTLGPSPPLAYLNSPPLPVDHFQPLPYSTTLPLPPFPPDLTRVTHHVEGPLHIRRAAVHDLIIVLNVLRPGAGGGS